MPRDINGNFTLVTGNPVVSGTPIESDWANSTMNDVAQAMTESLSRTGEGGMLVPLTFLDGGVSNPAISFTAEPTTGIYRAGTNDVRMSVASTDRMRWTSSGVQLWDTDQSIWLNIGASTPTLLTDTDDLDTIPTTDAGYFYWFDDSVPANTPEAGLSTLSVAPADTDNGTQYVYDLTLTVEFIRRKISGTWSDWEKAVPSSAVGGGGDNVFFNNDQVVTTDYTIPDGQNSMSAGPITINDGITVTIPTGSRWAVV